MKLGSMTLVGAALCTLTPQPADACSTPEFPTAEPINQGAEGGTRPWIRTFNVKDTDPVTMFTVAPTCERDWSSLEKAKIPCPAVKQVELERNGRYMRPKAPLPEGTKVQLVTGSTLISDFVIKRQHEKPVAYDSIKVGRRSSQPLQGCQLKGTQVDLTVKPPPGAAPYPFQNTFVLVYTKQPDPANPLTNLAQIVSVGPSGTSNLEGRVILRNTSYEPKYVPTKFPAKVWVRLSDEDDHIGPLVELTIK